MTADVTQHPSTGNSASDGGLSALDYRSIKQLLAKSNLALNTANAQQWLACFAAGGQYVVANDSSGPAAAHRGHDALLGYLQSVRENNSAHRLRRLTNMPRIDGAGNSATSFAYEYHFRPGVAGPVASIQTGICTARLEKSANGWLFLERRLQNEHLEHGQWAAKALDGLAQGGTTPPAADCWPHGIGKVSEYPAMDYEQICQTLAAFTYTMDLGDSAGLAALFTEHGCLHIIGIDHLYYSGSWHTKPTKPFFRGRQAIESFNRMSHAGGRPKSERHWYHPPLIEIDGNTATSVMQTATVLAGAAENIIPATGGIYKDHLRKINGRWLFEDRIIFAEHAPESLTEVIAAAAGQYVCNVA